MKIHTKKKSILFIIVLILVTLLLTSKSAAAEGVSQNSLVTPMAGSLDSTANHYITLSNSMTATGDGYTLNGNIIELDSSIPNAIYEISGTTASYTIKALNNYDITLNNATITLPSTVSSVAMGGIDLNGNTVTITLASGSRNGVEVRKDIAGIRTTNGILTINGDGFIEVYGYTNSAGIGGSNNESNGTINITGGNINVSGMWGSTAIGGEKNGNGGLVSISGGQIVTSGGLGGNSTNPGIVKITGGNFLPVGEVPTGYTNMNIQNAAGVPIYLNAYRFPSSITSPIIVSDANTSSGEILILILQVPIQTYMVNILQYGFLQILQKQLLLLLLIMILLQNILLRPKFEIIQKLILKLVPLGNFRMVL